MSALPRRRKPVRAEDLESEAEFSSWVVGLARQCRWRCFHSSDSRKQVRRGDRLIMVGDPEQSGFPDWTFVRERVVFAELKRQKGRLSASQEVWLEALREAGQEVYVWRPEDRGAIIRVLA